MRRQEGIYMRLLFHLYFSFSFSSYFLILECIPHEVFASTSVQCCTGLGGILPAVSSEYRVSLSCLCLLFMLCYRYSNLKKLVYLIEREQVSSAYRPSGDYERGVPSERTALISDSEAAVEADNSRFIAALDAALDKIAKFYGKKEKELYEATDQLLAAVHDLQQQQPVHRAATAQTRSPEFPRRESTVQGDSDLPPAIISQNVSDTDPDLVPVIASTTTVGGELGDELRKRTVDLFVLLSELKSFVALNQTAFSKILKKYDKITHSNLKRFYIAKHVSPAYPFRSTTKQILNERIQQTERAYAALVTQGNLDAAITELKTHLRERIVWERNMVWRDMVGQERKVQTAAGISEAKPIRIQTPLGTLQVTRDQIVQGAFLFISIVVFAVLLQAEIFTEVEQNRCFAILVLASMLWAGEVTTWTLVFPLG